MKVLIKLGGTLIDNPTKVKSIAGQLAVVARRHSLVVVHGGGKQVTRFLEDRGVQSKFVGGLRVSDATVIDAITKVIAGTVNKTLVGALIASGCPAFGLSGIDGLLTEATPLSSELQFVGKPRETNGRVLQMLLNAGFVPTVACLAGDSEGNLYNVNADQMAVSCSVGWGSERLIFLTDVPGVKDASGELLPRLTAQDSQALISGGVAHGGMQAKLEAAALALTAGQQVTIALGSEPDICTRLLNGEVLGTTLVPDQPLATAGPA